MTKFNHSTNKKCTITMPKSVIKVPNSAMNKFSDWFKERKIIGGVQLYNTSHTPLHASTAHRAIIDCSYSNEILTL